MCSINAPTWFLRHSKPFLLDHIYSNITQKEIFGKPRLFHISNHLPTCAIINSFSGSKKFKSKMKKCMKTRGRVFENVLGHEDTFWSPWPWSWPQSLSPWPWPRALQVLQNVLSSAQGQHYFVYG